MSNIEIGAVRHHQKASEAYVSIRFHYSSQIIEWDIPIEYRRTGTHLLEKSEKERREYIEQVYDNCNPLNWKKWKSEQIKFWATKPRAETTQAFFDVLSDDFKWKSVESDFPKNPNWARRIQDIKEFGYTLATDTARYDPKIKKNSTHILLIPLARGGITGYEVWTKELREKIIKIHNSFDCFEAKEVKKEGLLPDHKFPEIRWDINTKRISLEDLSDSDVKNDFQLLNNQRNQQKREVCRACYQTNERGLIYGINFFYKGTAKWDSKIPKRGKMAEEGCKGCGWYDINKWRLELNKKLNYPK
jgi:hypothetical protein